MRMTVSEWRWLKKLKLDWQMLADQLVWEESLAESECRLKSDTNIVKKI